jgi:hypothetical protein
MPRQMVSTTPRRMPLATSLKIGVHLCPSVVKSPFDWIVPAKA